MSWRRASAAKAAISAGGTVTPLGLPGVTSTIARVRGVIERFGVRGAGDQVRRPVRGTPGATPRIRSHMSWLK